MLNVKKLNAPIRTDHFFQTERDTRTPQQLSFCKVNCVQKHTPKMDEAERPAQWADPELKRNSAL